MRKGQNKGGRRKIKERGVRDDQYEEEEVGKRERLTITVKRS